MHFVAAALALFVTLVSSSHPASATVADDLCPAGADPCLIADDHLDITSGSTLDFGTREVRLQGGRTLDVGAGVMNILAGKFVLAPKAKLLAPGGFISITTTGAVELQTSGPDVARIDVSDALGGGEIDIEAQGPVTISGDLIAKGDDAEADGGDIFVSSGGDILVTRPLSVKGGSDSGGGTITFIAGGKLDVSAAMDASGGEFDGGDIDLSANANLTINANGDLDISGGSLSGSGGSVELLSTTGNVSLAGRITGTPGGSAEEGGGYGGTLDATALVGSVTLLDDIDVPGGDGGGLAGDGGDVTVIAGSAITLSTNIDSHGGKDTSSSGGDGAGGNVFAQGCDVTVVAGHVIDTQGASYGTNTLRAGGQLKVNGSVLTAQFNIFDYRDPAKPPIVTGTVSPSAQVTQTCDVPSCAGKCGNGTLDACESCDPGPDAAGDCCLASCRFSQLGTPCTGGVCNTTGVCGPPPTTTTSTTVTTSSSTSTTSTSTTTSTSIPGATTTTSTSTTSISTTSTSTTSSTTSTSTSTSTTSTSTTTIAGSSTTSSTTTTPTTSSTSSTSTTVPPTACGEDTAGQSCDDGDACTQADTCNASGQCIGGAPLGCDDENLCTDDGACDPASGCPAPQAKTGFAGVTCRLDAIDAALASAPAEELKTAGRKSIGTAVKKARAKLAIASNAPAGRKGTKAVKAAQTALRGITKAVNAARRKKTIGGALLGTVQGDANGALGSSQSLLP